MHATIGIAALFACALASPILPPIDPNNPLTNPNTNRDLYLTNPAWINPSGAHMTPEQVATIQNQFIAQRNLEAVAAQLAAQAAVVDQTQSVANVQAPAPVFQVPSVAAVTTASQSKLDAKPSFIT
ncbi:hypothetical protein GGI00_000198 [Coemansia sp. RSA 2681]|nr:hypothetical protein GGI00_000198 [Coemansia sp. RSA 2681]